RVYRQKRPPGTIRAAFLVRQRLRLANRTPADQIDDREQNDRAEQRIQERLYRNGLIDAATEQEARDHCAAEPDDDMENDALLSVVAHDQAGEPAANAS